MIWVHGTYHFENFLSYDLTLKLIFREGGGTVQLILTYLKFRRLNKVD